MSSREVGIVVLVIFGALVLLPVLGMSVWGGWGMMGPHMGRWGYGPGFGPGFGGGPLVVLLLIGGIVLIVLSFTRKDRKEDEPLEVLKRRLAKGEITKEQYTELKETLQ